MKKVLVLVLSFLLIFTVAVAAEETDSENGSQVELGQYTNLDLEIETAEVSEAEINQRLEEMQQEQTQLVSAEKGALETGDLAIIDFKGFVDGEQFQGGTAEEYELEIGSQSFIPGFEDQLIGMEPGEERTIEVTFPENYHSDELAGVDTQFEVKLRDIRVEEVPELNDDFAARVSDYQTLDQLKASIEAELKEEKEWESQNNFRSQIILKAAENSEVELSDEVIEEELDFIFQSLSQAVSQQGMSVEEYLMYLEMDVDDWREENREVAVSRAKQKAVLNAIADAENIEVSEEEVDAEIVRLAEAHAEEPENIRELLEFQGQFSQFVEDIRNQKTIDFLLENN